MRFLTIEILNLSEFPEGALKHNAVRSFQIWLKQERKVWNRIKMIPSIK